LRKCGATLNCGTLDTLHVALAQLAGCTWFLSFDTNSNARMLAASARLKVYPELTTARKSQGYPLSRNISVNILDTIIAQKRVEVAALRPRAAELKRLAAARSERRDFAACRCGGRMGVWPSSPR